MRLLKYGTVFRRLEKNSSPKDGPLFPPVTAASNSNINNMQKVEDSVDRQKIEYTQLMVDETSDAAMGNSPKCMLILKFFNFNLLIIGPFIHHTRACLQLPKSQVH